MYYVKVWNEEGTSLPELEDEYENYDLAVSYAKKVTLACDSTACVFSSIFKGGESVEEFYKNGEQFDFKE